MIHQYRLNRFLLLLLMVISSLQLFAGVEPYQNQLKGTIKKGDSLVVKDEKFRNPNFDWNEITNRTVKNFVSLQLTNDTPVVLNQAFSCEVDLKVEYFSTPDQAEPVAVNSVKLKVNFSPETGATYKAKDVYTFSNGYLVKITVNNISSPELGENIPPVLQLTSQVVIDRDYVYHPEKSVEFSGIFSTTSTEIGALENGLGAMSVSTASASNNNFLNLTWASIPGAEYDIEWAVYDENVTDKQALISQVLGNQNVDPILLDELFLNNATRVTTAGNSYSITMVYTAKYLLVRMRQVHYTNGYRDEDEWDYKVTDPSGTPTGYAIWEIPEWHEINLNWQYTAAFAEEGKKKEVVNYYDGSLRSRQTVTINNSDNVAVVQETIYDEFGRGAANILPAPTDDNKFHYYQNFNLAASGASYDYNHLKHDVGAFCEYSPEALKTTSGAARYYSVNNPFLNDQHPNYRKYNKYIPDAEGYAMSVTQYVHDNTNRIRTQGGVGPDFQPGKNNRHVTKYYYGKPEQYELDRLFGNDVGYASHYLKNMVVDQNEQISVSYLNGSGKTIATAFTGSTEKGVDALPSKPAPEQKTFTFLRPSQFTFDPTALSLYAKTSYLNSVPNAPASFNYDIQKLIYTYQGTTAQGAPFQVCSNCFYDLTIRVTNDCGQEVPTNLTLPIPIGSLTGDCNNTGTHASSFDVTFSEIGEYYISFEFKLRNKAIDDYTDTYIKQRTDNGSLRSELSFVNDYLNSSDFNGCFSDCSTCDVALGTVAEFGQAIKTKLTDDSVKFDPNDATLNDIINRKYNELRAQCIALRANCMVSSCSKFEQAMLDDVTPGGQYALFNLDPFTALEQDINVIYLHWREAFPVQSAGSTDYEAEAIYDENGNKTSPYDASFTLELLVKYWREEWATKFIKWHPEKCKLDFCSTNSTYIMWDDQVQTLIAKASDIPNIPRTSGLYYNYGNAAWLLSQDPFFKPGAPGNIYLADMQNDLNQFSSRIMGVTAAGASVKGLTQVIDYLLYCSDLDGSTNAGPVTNADTWNNCNPVSGCRVPDKEWSQYKDIYFQLKQKYYQQVRTNTTCAASCSVGTPYGPPSGCATRNDFTIEKVIGDNNGCTGTGIQSVRISYAKGAAARPMTVELYYPGEFLSFNKTTSVQFAIGESDKIICISDKILVRSIKVRSVTCTGPAINTCIAGGSSDQLMLTGNVQQLASNKFQQTTPAGLVTTYTIVAGKQNQPPADATYCTDGVLVRKDFYNCFKLYMPNSTIPVQFFNVWVVGCQKNLCATVAEYTFEYKYSQYRYYDNGRNYYIKLQSGEGEQCGTAIDWKSCIRVNGQIFLNAGISSCDACSGSGVQTWNLGNPISTNPLVYSDGNGGTIEVFPNTAANSNPASARCANPYSREWYPCLKISNGPTLFNASIVRCAPDPCATAESIYTTKFQGGPYENWIADYSIILPESADFWYLIPGDPNTVPYWWLQLTPTEYHFANCVKAYVNGTLHGTYQNVWIAHYRWTEDGLEQWMLNQKGPAPMMIGGDTLKVGLQVPANFIAFNYKSPDEVTTGKYSFQFNNSWMASPCPEAYGYKKARFPEFNYQYGTSSQDLQGIQDENNGIILAQIKSNCEAQADKWMEKLEACVAPYGDAKMQELKAKLIEVCTNGGDLDHPYGSSTVKPGTTGTASFKDAILQVLGLNALTMTCNPWLIDEPHPFDPKTQAVSKTIGATNASLCARVQELTTDAGGPANLFNYLKNKYGDAMNLTNAQVDILLKSCNNCRYLLEKDIPLPVFMEPGAVGCVDATEYNNGKTAFEAEMGSNLVESHANYQDMLANYLNHRWGFSMAYYRYQEYEEQLAKNGSAILCSNPPYTEVEVDRYTCVKTVVAAAIVNGRRDYDQYIAEEKRLFRLNYAITCGKAQASSKLTTKQQTYHYTLFYYDQAGNLVRTVSPEGVRFLSDAELSMVDEFRKADEVVDCSAFGTPATESKTVAFNAFGSALQSGNVKSMEMWLNGSGATRQVRFVTPDNKYFYQAAITNNKLWVELYSMTPGATAADGIAITLSNQAVADITGITLQPWSHIFIQGNNFAGDPWSLYLDGRKLTMVPDPTALPYPFDWEIGATSGGLILPSENIGQLKHLRIYNRFASDAEMGANFGNQCQAPEGQLSIRTNPLVMWARLNMPSTCTNTTDTRVVGNRGALQVGGNLNANYGLAFNDINNTFTVEMWVKPQTTHQLDAQSQTGLDGTTGQKFAIYPTTYTAASGKAGMGISIGTNGISVYEHADGYMPPLLVWPGNVTTWTHIAVVYNNGTPSLYVNGNFAATGLPSAKQVSPSYNFCSGPYGNMTGNLDEVRVWNIARTQADINADYRRSIPPSTAGLVAYWPMSREDGGILYDMSCAHIPVTLNSNYSWTTATSPVVDVVPLEYSVLGLFPRHRLVTSMAYNSSNKVVQHKSPDGGHTYFWYDALSRIIASQNEEQRSSVDNPNRYTYNLYEPTLGRSLEVGEKSNGKILPAPGYLTQQAVGEFLNSGTNAQITQTIYDKIPAAGSGVETGLLQENLRKQVSATYYKETQTSPVSQAVYYSYDLTGNVKTIWRQVDGLALKRMDYEYDLVSGKTNFVRYQDGQNDRFYYAYKYDAENRVIESYSGTEAQVSVRGSTLLNGQLDAFYQYYLHGPLARTEIGQNKVQGVDYAYTLHGWMKGINGHKLNATAEMGNDGNSGNNPMAKDVMAYALGYYKNDYKPIGTGAGAFSMTYSAAPGDITGSEMFNGNISNTTVALEKLRNGDPVGYTYRYDQLNRLKEMRYHPLSAATTTWDNSTRDDSAYKESLTYDGNGNILRHIRNGANTANMNMAMDDLTYNYKKEIDPVNNQEYYVNNQLQHVHDDVDENYYKKSVNDIEDLDNQDPENYKYDNIGNLVKDVKSGIEKISWTIYGKVNSVLKTDGTLIAYAYDPGGNRVKKITTVNNVSSVTWYGLDALGNKMAVYDDKQDGQAGTWWKEQHLYGNSRIGIWSPRINIAAAEGTSEWGILGKKTYELTNHLKNVIVTITDKKMAVSSSGSTVDHYAAEVTSAQDYYPFGMQQPGRTFEADKYGYGFNDQEKADEIAGSGNHYTALFWEYDPRLGKRWNVDPATGKHPDESPYLAFHNNPIFYTDPMGDEPPEGFKKVQGKGGELAVPQSTKTDYKKGQLESFTIGKKTFTAQYDEGGEFKGYYNGTEKYENPDITIESGGIDGNNLDVVFRITGVHATGLQLIQTVHKTGMDQPRRKWNDHGVWYDEKGMMPGSYFYKEGNTEMMAQVDGAEGSVFALTWKSKGDQTPNGASYPGKPYYNNPNETDMATTWDGFSGSIRVADAPDQQYNTRTNTFTSMIIAVNYMETGQDVVLATFRWGWTETGKKAIHTGVNIKGTPDKPMVPNKTELNTIHHFFKDYQFFK